MINLLLTITMVIPSIQIELLSLLNNVKSLNEQVVRENQFLEQKNKGLSFRKRKILHDHDQKKRRELLEALEIEHASKKSLNTIAKYASMRRITRKSEDMTVQFVLSLTTLIRNANHLNIEDRKALGIYILYVISNNFGESLQIHPFETLEIDIPVWKIRETIIFYEVKQKFLFFKKKNSGLSFRNVCAFYSSEIIYYSLTFMVPTNYARKIERRQTVVLTELERCLCYTSLTDSEFLKIHQPRLLRILQLDYLISLKSEGKFETG